MDSFRFLLSKFQFQCSNVIWIWNWHHDLVTSIIFRKNLWKISPWYSKGIKIEVISAMYLDEVQFIFNRDGGGGVMCYLFFSIIVTFVWHIFKFCTMRPSENTIVIDKMWLRWNLIFFKKYTKKRVSTTKNIIKKVKLSTKKCSSFMKLKLVSQLYSFLEKSDGRILYPKIAKLIQHFLSI